MRVPTCLISAQFKGMFLLSFTELCLQQLEMVQANRGANRPIKRRKPPATGADSSNRSLQFVFLSSERDNRLRSRSMVHQCPVDDQFESETRLECSPFTSGRTSGDSRSNDSSCETVLAI
ncbi:hypothetical protein PoB_001228000 [Plakobranchus ocellatus]|uniref:Uncharacterized protein n=1 Tax=Plakobranchus ocellatus TaxID=259542 RepID=A0AAV3YRK0_9GAST|nr:hypothetical protein PoB_001228000 [Plakobranchus ocellatus]